MRDDIYNFLRAQLMPAALTLFLGLSFLGALSTQPNEEDVAPPTISTQLPSEVQGLGGPIKIKLVKNPVDEDGEELWGSFEASTRTIEIESEAGHDYQWHILGHELCHATLFDSGLLNTISDEGQEALCDAFGTARIQEMRDRG